MILRNITHHSNETSLADALIAVSAFSNLKPVDAFYFRTIYLLKQGQYTEARKLLSNLIGRELKLVCDKLYSYTMCQLNSNYTEKVNYLFRKKISV